jgi:ATP-dependent helicase HepA
MLRRFNLPFTILDEDRCRALAENGDEYDNDFAADDDITAEIDAIDRSAINPFDTTQLVLCSLSFLTDNPLRQQQALEAGWDIMVVDEAHHLEWHAEQPSTAYQCVETLARAIPSLLLHRNTRTAWSRESLRTFALA